MQLRSTSWITLRNEAIWFSVCWCLVVNENCKYYLLNNSYLNATSKKAGSITDLACNHKHDHYTMIKASNSLLVAKAFGTKGPWCKEILNQ